MQGQIPSFIRRKLRSRAQIYEKELGAKIEMMLRNEEAPESMPSAAERKKKIMHDGYRSDGAVLIGIRGSPNTSPAAGIFGL